MMSSYTSPETSIKMNESAKDISLFDPDTKDSGFCEDSLEDSQKFLQSPYQLDEESTIGFSPHGDAFEATPNEKLRSANKRRLFRSPIKESPSLAAANSFKRLRLFELDNTPKSVASEDFPGNFPDEILAAASDDESIGPLTKISKCLDAQRGAIKEAVEKSLDGNLVGDFSKDYALPLINKNSELKMISVDTMKDILDGKYKDVLHSFKIIDSRYPYEYKGGHIRGAVNLYTKNACLRLLDNPLNAKDERHVLIFHCEFSKERGPKMNKSLRKEDRTRNAMNYPALKYPEIYVLEGGYKKFFENHPEYCDPNNYTPMLHPENLEDLKFYRNERKTENVMGTSKRGSKVRSTPAIRKTLSNDFF